MSQPGEAITELRRFCAYCSTAEGYSAPLRLEAPDFHDAAVHFAEHWHGDGELGVLVIDEESGEQACFSLDLGS
jgi:hypothetical protein